MIVKLSVTRGNQLLASAEMLEDVDHDVLQEVFNSVCQETVRVLGEETPDVPRIGTRMYDGAVSDIKHVLGEVSALFEQGDIDTIMGYTGLSHDGATRLNDAINRLLQHVS